MARLVARRSVLVAGAALGLIGYGLWPREERRILSLLGELCAELNQTRSSAGLTILQAKVQRAFLTDAVIHAPELGADLYGPDAIARRASDLLEVAPLSFALSDAEVRVSGGLARVTANLIVVVRGSGEQQRDLRFTEVRLKKLAGQWRIERVTVDPVRPFEPEARP